MENKSIVQWCKDLHEAGNELTMKWEGGGDSGWVYFEIDGESADNEYTRALVNRMDDTLNYGSWAGEFSASGTAVYDPEKNAFEGTDFYGEDSNEVIDTNVIIKVPKSFWFDTLHVEVEAYYDEAPAVSVQLLVKNGFLTQEHTNICSNLEEVLKDDFTSLFNNYESTENHEFRGCNDSWILERSEALEEDDDLVFTISKIHVQTIDREDRNIVLELDEETANAIDDDLNDTEDEN
jgi:hypothetical protein